MPFRKTFDGVAQAQIQVTLRYAGDGETIKFDSGVTIDYLRDLLRRCSANLVRRVEPKYGAVPLPASCFRYTDDEATNNDQLPVSLDAIHKGEIKKLQIHLENVNEDSPPLAQVGKTLGTGGRNQLRFLTATAPFEKSNRKITVEELAKHNTEDDCWVAYQGCVYDITNYLNSHPGGKRILLQCAGKDCTRLFLKYHPWVNGHAIMQSMLKGRFAPL